jgi:hypothetical protein
MIYAIVTCRLTNNNSLAVICIHLFLLCAPAPLDDSQTLVQSMHNKTCWRHCSLRGRRPIANTLRCTYFHLYTMVILDIAYRTTRWYFISSCHIMRWCRSCSYVSLGWGSRSVSWWWCSKHLIWRWWTAVIQVRSCSHRIDEIWSRSPAPSRPIWCRSVPPIRRFWIWWVIIWKISYNEQIEQIHVHVRLLVFVC